MQTAKVAKENKKRELGKDLEKIGDKLKDILKESGSGKKKGKSSGDKKLSDQDLLKIMVSVSGGLLRVELES